MIDQILYRPKVVAQLFGVAEETIRRLCHDGRIPAVNLGTWTHARWRIPLSFIEQAMRGEARWKYPKVLKRQCINRSVALRRLSRVNDEMARIARNEAEWSDDDE